MPVRPSGTKLLVDRFLDGEHHLAGELVRCSNARSVPALIKDLGIGGRLTTETFDVLADTYHDRELERFNGPPTEEVAA